MSKQSLSNEAPWNQLARTARYPVHLSEVLDVITSNPIHPPSDANMVMVRTLIEHKEVMLASKSSINPLRLWRDMT